MTKNYNKIIFDLGRKFVGTKYAGLVEQATDAYIDDDYKKLDEIISSFPNEVVLLEQLIKKLEGKSVYTNLQKLLEHKDLKKVAKTLK